MTGSKGLDRLQVCCAWVYGFIRGREMGEHVHGGWVGKGSMCVLECA